MKKILALILAFTATSAFADVSGGVTLASDYFSEVLARHKGNLLYNGIWKQRKTEFMEEPGVQL